MARHNRPTRLALSAAVVALAAGAAAAQGFGEGSFEEGSFGETAPERGAGAGGGSWAEGSFEPGGSAPPPADTGGGALPPPGGTQPTPPPDGGDATPPPPPPPPDGGGGAWDEGSFEPGNDGGGGGGGGGGLPPPQDGSIPPPPPPPPPPEVVTPPPDDPAPGPGGVRIDPQIAVFETRDFGVPPQRHLRPGEFHAPTPTALPGGRLITTQDLANLMQGNRPVLMIDALGGQYSLPGALGAPALASAGSFEDRVQQQAVQWLGQITRGDRSVPIVLFCSDPMCWLSYNAALRTIAAGYGDVYWYRGGLRAWEMAGLPLRPMGF